MPNRLLRSDVVRNIVLVAAVFLAVTIVLWIALDNKLYVVTSESMQPTLNPDDVIIVDESTSISSLKVGNIIAFYKPNWEDLGLEEAGLDRDPLVIVHRVVEIADGNMMIVKTKGDNNDDIIEGRDYPVTEENLIGKITMVVPGLGLFARVISPPLNYVIAAVAIIAALSMITIKRKKKGANQKQI